MLEIKNLAVTYNGKGEEVNALGPINIDIKNGDIYAVIGPSGCGKSTFLNVLAGIIKDYKGEVLLDKEKLTPYNKVIGLIPQNSGLLPWKTCMENCMLPLKIKKRKVDNNIKNRIEYIFDKLNISSLKHRYPNELSGGQRQRVATAKAFIMNPDVLLMDEPFSALDTIIREEAQELFLDMWNKYKTTTVFITHSVEEAIYMGKKIIVMSNHPGTIIEKIDNPLFNKKDFREGENYKELSKNIRELIKKGWEA